jgi:hypothetical protein
MKKKKIKIKKDRAANPAAPAADPRKVKADKIPTLELEPMIAMLKALLAGADVKPRNLAEKKTKAELLRDIALAEENGWQIEIPNI